MIATLILVLLNMIIPILMIFTSYRNILNFYFSSAALSSSLINCLYVFYLAQTLRSKVLTENNCRAMYYLQTSCIVVLAYTITVMHANFILCLFFPTSDQHQSNRTCLQSCGVCLRRFFRRFCFCLVLLIWSLSFTATIPLLYTIDSNEKVPRPVYCPGTTQLSYLDEWFDHNRFNQTVLFNLIPLLTSIFLTLLALLKLFCDWLVYIYSRLKVSKCSPCRKKFSNQQRHGTSIPHSMTMLSSLGIMNNSNTQSGFNLSPIIESPTPTSDITMSSSDFTIQPCRHWCSTSSLSFLLVISCCLLACIYPIAMRFYIVYFSVLVPLIFAVFNYSVGQLTSTTTQQQQQQQPESTMESHNMVMTTAPRRQSISPIDTQIIGKVFGKEPSVKQEGDESSTEQFELRPPLIENLSNEHDERERFVITPTSSSQSSTTCPSHYHRLIDKQKYFSNHLYENTRNMFMK